MPDLTLPDRELKTFWYLGVDGQLAQGSDGNEDLGDAIEFVALSNAYAPAGIGGEAVFKNVYLSIFRDNTEDVLLEITPIIDEVEQDPIDLTLVGIASAARSVYELGLAVYYPSTADPQIATAQRGTWFQLEIRSVGAPESIGRVDGRIVMEGLELEYEVEREGRQASNVT